MSILSGKKILLGISAGIAAYKSAFLVRLFVRAGAEVRVVMTPDARDFVTPLTLSTLSKNEVLSSFTDEGSDEATWNNHVELALWADLFVIAPATANTLSKMAHGTSDNLLLATYLSAKCPVYYAPAMDLDMYRHPTTAVNFDKLKAAGNIQIPAETGELASGLSGQGRMAEPENILSFIEDDILRKLPLRGKKVLVTAGPTYEPIDPVRFVGNHSSGKMGFELAKTAAGLGGEVTLVSGPTHQRVQHKQIELVPVTTAEEMYEAVHACFADTDIVVMAAAVADYRPKAPGEKKIKKNTAELNLPLEPTQDILASLGTAKKGQFLVGFALETDDELENAKKKLKKKNLDVIVLNSLNDPGAGFNKDTNKVTLIDKNGGTISFDTRQKSVLARDIFGQVLKAVKL